MEPKIKNRAINKTNSSRKPVIEYLNFTSGEKISEILYVYEIIFIITGQCEISSDTSKSFMLSADQSVFLPAKTYVNVSFNEDCRVLVMRLEPFEEFYGFYAIKELYDALTGYSLPENTGILTMGSLIKQYFDSLLIYIQDGINQPHFYNIKIREFLLILGKCYSKKELCHFFRPALNSNAVFTAYILTKWKNAINPTQLQQESTYSEKEFNKKFEDIFGTSPQKWLKQKKRSTILTEILHTYKPFDLLAKEYSFDSPQKFIEFCVVNFDQTPEQLRGK